MSSQIITAEAPTLPPKKLVRIDVLDVLRGFALLGIFLMNIEYFNRSLLEQGAGIPAGTVGMDYIFARGTEIFVTGKFWILFSLLFGMGFVVMETQAVLDGRPFFKMYLRRIAALMMFGLLHIGLLWPGDILHSYALVAFIMLWLPVLSSRVSFWLGTGMYLMICLLALLGSLVLGFIPASEHESMLTAATEKSALAKQAAAVYASGDFWQVAHQRWQDFFYMLGTEPIILVAALGIFLMGAGIMRSGRLLDLPAHRNYFFKMMLLCACLAASIVLFASQFHGHPGTSSKGLMEQALMMLGSLPFSLFYLAAIAYCMSFTSGIKYLSVLAPAGKMALTNYLMQSLISSGVFFGYGLGMWGQWGRASLVLFVVLVFVVQVIISHMWLRYFRYGPMEWLWRALTYWTLPPMRILSAK